MQGKRYRWPVLTVATGLAAMLSILASAQAASDAGCPGPFESNLLISAPPSGNGRIAQTFTAQAGGVLTMAQAAVFKGGSVPGDWVMRVNEVGGTGTPNNTILASATIPD